MQFAAAAISPPRTTAAPVCAAASSALINPVAKPSTSLQSFEATRTHLSNLERLLQKQSSLLPMPQPPSPPKQLVKPSRQRSFLKALKLPPALCPFFNRNNNVVAAEEFDMSPRSLTQLHHLLSDSSGPSPRKEIAPNWREFHGFGNWDGLLDPLDENLRRELVRYGDFVGAAYHAFHSDPDVPADSHRDVSLPDKNYRVTRGLHATASLAIPGWAESLVPSWMAQRSSWIGYIAVCESESEIKRMGRRDIVIALRGTSTCLEWAENFRAGLVPLPVDGEEVILEGSSLKVVQPPKVECGFWSLYNTRGERFPSLSEALVEEVLRLTEQYKGEQLSITITGHSMGAALAVFAADELSSLIPKQTAPVAVFSFGGPRVGNAAFARRVSALGVKVLRVVNAHDVVTRVPGKLLPLSGDIDWYVDIGNELRVDSRASPYLRPDADPACCHDLESYLHLVDGYLAKNCPFRANAKRSLVRLLRLQGSNMKKLYVSKARAMGIDPIAGTESPPRTRREMDKPRQFDYC